VLSLLLLAAEEEAPPSREKIPLERDTPQMVEKDPSFGGK